MTSSLCACNCLRSLISGIQEIIVNDVHCYLLSFVTEPFFNCEERGGGHYGNKPHGELVASNHDGATCHSCRACK